MIFLKSFTTFRILFSKNKEYGLNMHVFVKNVTCHFENIYDFHKYSPKSFKNGFICIEIRQYYICATSTKFNLT